MYKIKNIHFIGIGGAGMSGIAEVLNNLGYAISGSDLNENASTRLLAKSGVKITIGHDAKNVNGSDAVVFSTAIPNNNPELIAARKQGLPIVPRATMLNELLRLRQGIAVAGSHGKTTITSMVASVLHEAKLDPTYIVGGQVRKFGSNAGLGKGEFIVVETDESDGSFLHLSPVIAIASNIDSDHLQTYGQDIRLLKRAFIDFFENLPFYGVAILCHDDSQLLDVSKLLSKRVISYGTKHDNVDFFAKDIKVNTSNTTYQLISPYGEISVELNALGNHNVVNSLAAFAVADEIGIKPEVVVQALANFAGVGRRLEIHGDVVIGDRKVLLIDDYAHHPTEITVTIDAVRKAYPERKLCLVFQPHRYSRTRDCFDNLTDVLATVDLLVLTEIYPAGEAEILEANGEALLHAIHLRGNSSAILVKDLGEIPDRLAAVCSNNDIVITMGAGSINSLAETLKGVTQ